MKAALAGLVAVAVFSLASEMPASAAHSHPLGLRSSFRALTSAYCLHGHTASGTAVAPGTVAVDPAVIRLGSRLWIPGYGRGVALDTGGAIRGARLDLWMGSCAAAYRWGMREVTVTVWRR